MRAARGSDRRSPTRQSRYRGLFPTAGDKNANVAADAVFSF
jgi:hypothetical protein